MTRKLFAFAKGECAAESADNPMFQELLLGGQLYGMILKVRYCQIISFRALHKCLHYSRAVWDYS